MTKIIIDSVSPDAPGSYRLLIGLMEDYAEAFGDDGEMDMRAAARLFRRVEQYLEKYATTDDGTPVAEALERMSWNEMQALVEGIIGGVADVPKENAAASGGG